MSDFEKWFEAQYFYTNMRFVHGDALFIKDGDVYRVLLVQMAWEAFKHIRQKTKDERMALTQEWHTKGWGARQDEIDHLTTMNQRYIGKMQEQQDQIAELEKSIQKMKLDHCAYKKGIRKVVKALRGDDDINLSS